MAVHGLRKDSVLSSVVGHFAQFFCSPSSDTWHSGEAMGGAGCCVLAPDWSKSYPMRCSIPYAYNNVNVCDSILYMLKTSLNSV